MADRQGFRGGRAKTSFVWDHGFPLENTNPPHPENPEKLQFGPPRDRPENYRKLLKNYKITENLLKNYTFSNFSVIFRKVPGRAKL